MINTLFVYKLFKLYFKYNTFWRDERIQAKTKSCCWECVAVRGAENASGSSQGRRLRFSFALTCCQARLAILTFYILLGTGKHYLTVLSGSRRESVVSLLLHVNKKRGKHTCTFLCVFHCSR